MLTYSIDSLKLRVPLSVCTIKNPKFNSHSLGAILDTVTGEIDLDKDFKKASFKVEEHGVKTKYLIQKQKTSLGLMVDHLFILFNSKLLGSDYLHGITKDNVERVYTALMAQDVVSVPFPSFLDGNCTDVDFKADIPCAREAMKKAIAALVARTKPSKHKDKGIALFNSKENLGVSWGKRETAVPSVPFIKLYSKLTELKYNSTEFYTKYFNEGEIDDSLRVEWTLKGAKHLKQGFSEAFPDSIIEDDWGRCISDYVQGTGLSQLLNIDQMALNEMGRVVLSKHLVKGIKMTIKKESDDLAPMDQVVLNALDFMRCYKADIDIVEAVEVLTKGLTKQNKYLWKKKITALWTMEMTPEEANTEFEVLNIFEQLGLVD